MLKRIHGAKGQCDRIHLAWPGTEPTCEKTLVGCVHNHLLSHCDRQPTHRNDSHHQRSLGLPRVFFFLSFLSFVDGWYSSTMAPKVVFDLLAEKKTISFSGCVTQPFAGHFCGGVAITPSQWWPASATWPSASPYPTHHNEQARVWPPGGRGLGWGISTHSD